MIPRRRRLARWLLFSLVVFVLGHSLLTFVTGRRLVRTLERIEARWGSLAPNAYAPGAVPPERNQARALRAATDALSLTPDEVETVGRFNAEQDVEIASVLERHADALALVDEAGTRGETDWELAHERLLEAELPPLLVPLLELRQLASLNQARARRIFLEGNADGALAVLAAGWAINHSLSQEPIMILQLLALVVEQEHLSTLGSMLESSTLSAETLAQWSGLVAAASSGPERHIGLIGEMKLVNIYWDFEMGGLQNAPVPPALTVWPIRWLLRPLFRENFRVFMERLSAYAEYDLVPFHERDKRFATPPHEAPFRFYHSLARAILPADSRYTQQRDVLDAERQLARVALALRSIAFREGAYPSSLQEVDVDATDPFSGAALGYEVDGESVTVTSAGATLEKLRPEERERLTWTWKR